MMSPERVAACRDEGRGLRGAEGCDSASKGYRARSIRMAWRFGSTRGRPTNRTPPSSAALGHPLTLLRSTTPSSSSKSSRPAPRRSITAASSAAISRCRASSIISFSIPSGGSSIHHKRGQGDAIETRVLSERRRAARSAGIRGCGRGAVPRALIDATGRQLEFEQRQPWRGVAELVGKPLPATHARKGPLDRRRLVETCRRRNRCRPSPREPACPPSGRRAGHGR